MGILLVAGLITLPEIPAEDDDKMTTAPLPDSAFQEVNMHSIFRGTDVYNTESE